MATGNNNPTIQDIYDIVNYRFDKLDVILNKHNERLTALEKFRDRALFMWAGLCLIATVVYNYIRDRFLK